MQNQTLHPQLASLGIVNASDAIYLGGDTDQPETVSTTRFVFILNQDPLVDEFFRQNYIIEQDVEYNNSVTVLNNVVSVDYHL